MSAVIFNKLGKITKGDEVGHYVKLVDDTNGSTGGFYAFTTEDLNDDSPIYDTWFEYLEGLKEYVVDCEITWFENMESVKMQVH